MLHSYANPAHERRAAEIVRAEYPDCTLSLSCDVLPEYREYERAVTTLVDAFIKPHMSRYLDRIRDELGPELNKKPFLVMQSSGGVASPDQVMRKPITTALSGPAAGALGSAVIAEIAGFPDLVTLDAGGTSTDLCLIEGAKPKITNGGRVGRFPVRIPMLDIKTIGTGGGSIAWISREGKLRVGPRSAGAVPGPMCYPNGGDEPTITDANLVLGRIPPALIGGGIKLDVERARGGLKALAARLPGNLSAEQLADGIIEIANWDQANAIRQMTIQRGIDPGAFALLSFGGSGPAQSPAVMELMGMKTCIVPPNPGNLSAFGLLAVDWRTDHIVTKVMHEESIDLAAVAAIYASLEKDGIATLEKDGIAPSKDRADARSRCALCRTVDGSAGAGACGQDRRAIRRRPDRCVPRRASENLRLQLCRPAESRAGEFLRVRLRHDRPSEHSRTGQSPARRRSQASRPVYFDGQFRDTPVFARASLPAGFTLAGPGDRRGIRLDHGGVSRPGTDRRSARHPDRQVREELGRYLLRNAYTPDDFFDPHHGVPVAQTRRGVPDPPPFRGRRETAAGFCIDEIPRGRGLRFSPPARGRDRVGVSFSKELFRVPPMMNVHGKEWPWPTAPDLPRREVDPIVLQIVEGTLNSIEAEIEYAIERTARSPMIREAHDYRVGLFDRYCRKLTGRSYSAMPNAVVRDFPPHTMRPGDVFLMNDTYLTEGSIGHLPDLCSTVPVFHQGEVVAYIQAFGHHDDIGGRVPGSMPGTATTVFEEGLAVPPIKFYDAGVRNDAVFTIIKRNTRVPETLAADLDSEVQACLMGARRMAELFERFGRETVEACFQAILDTCRDIFRRELLPKIADGEYRWEDYVEHDGVTDPKLHKLVLTLIKKGERLTLDFTGTDPQSTGPINWPADYAGGAFLIKWIAPILRNLADTPERAAEIHVNEGVCEVFDIVFPPKGTLITPEWPAATNARSFVLLRCLGLLAGVVAQAAEGRMPADQETIRYTGFYGIDRNGKAFLSREVLGGGSGGRYYADGNDAIHIVPDFAQPAGRIHRDAVSAPGREIGVAHGFRRRRQTPRRPRLRQALPRAGRLPHHRHRRPRAARLLRRQWRQGRHAVLRDRRCRGQPARSRRPGRRRAGSCRSDRARRDDGRRRLGRSARARAGTRRARRDRGQGFARRRARRLWRGCCKAGGGDNAFTVDAQERPPCARSSNPRAPASRR